MTVIIVACLGALAVVVVLVAVSLCRVGAASDRDASKHPEEVCGEVVANSAADKFRATT